jgi:sugar lactone lactonase YvrE
MTIRSTQQDRHRASTREVVYEDLAFGEAPRWHDGRLWLSDIFAKRVVALEPGGSAEIICEVGAHPCGLGWLPDGRLLVVSMADRRLLRLENGELVEHADLSAACPGNLNDMVVDGGGRAYVGNTGYEYLFRGQPVPVRKATSLVMVTPEGDVVPQPGTLMFPNGCAISADGRTLVVAQSHAGRLTAYDVAADGSLERERPFANLTARYDHPDGICMDAEGAVWMADPAHKCCVRVVDGGQITHVIDTAPWECIACTLGGDDRRTLFLVLAPDRNTGAGTSFAVGIPPATERIGRVEAARVDVPGAGWP